MKTALYSPYSSTRTKPEGTGKANEKALTTCRGCAREGLRTILDMGSLPLANALLNESQFGDPEPKVPLVLAFCTGCSLVQITETVPAELLFRHYVYFSSFSDTVLRESRELARRMTRMRGLDGKSRVLEIASNDGYLLQFYKEAGIPVLGIEPAENVARAAQDRGIRTLCQFFGREVALQLQREGQQADVIHANNVLAHVEDLDGFIEGLRGVLKPDGVAVIEVPHVKEMIERLEFDTIYHEHLSYFSLASLARLFEALQLIIVDAEQLAIHGGSLRLFVEHASKRTVPTHRVRELTAGERECGVTGFEFYEGFANKVQRLKESLTAQLNALKADGHQIAAHGASAKGTTLLNYFGIGGDILDFVADRSTVKQGLYTPGTHLPIYAPEKLLETMPDYVLLLTWNFANEILEQEKEYRRRGGRFIVPIPEPRLI
jgi:2-polyprenyl-3-methyl-5-hydroxy-6-metoxy-1,4-benzoquinol methylase